MKKRKCLNAPVILNKMTGFLFVSYIRNKTPWNLICYVLLVIYSLLLFVNPAYGLEVSSSNYSLSAVAFLSGGGALSSVHYNAVWTAAGESAGSPATLTGTQFSSQVGQLFLLVTTKPMLWVVTNLQAKTDVLGLIIPERIWQKDNDPYFYWQVDVVPPDKAEGFSFSLDTLPQLEINTTEPNYQFPPNSITSGKHIFYVLPYTRARGWDEKSLLSFEIWVDVQAPVVSSMQPTPASLTSNNHIPISCTLTDAHSGIDKLYTTLTLNNQAVLFDYDVEKQLLGYKPVTPLSEGDNTLLLKAVDAVGNFVVKGWNFIVDTQSPSGSILINAGQETTHSAYVSINIEAQDATSGIKNIYLSNDGVFDTELNKPYSYSPLIPNWLLRDADTNGAKAVYAKFEDFAGNFSQAYQAEINLDLLAPNTRIISGPPTVTEETEATFMYEASKAPCLFSYKLDNADWSNWQSEYKVHFGTLDIGNHYFYVKSGFDLNGDSKITIDEEDPTPAQWVWTIKPQGYFEKLRERILFWRR